MPVQVRPNGFTVKEYAARYGMGYDQAQNRLVRLVSRGVVRCLGKWVVSGRQTNVYDVVEGAAKE